LKKRKRKEERKKLVGKGSRGGKRQDWGNIDYWLISKRRSTRVPGL
jgi:hypothetical protein